MKIKTNRLMSMARRAGYSLVIALLSFAVWPAVPAQASPPRIYLSPASVTLAEGASQEIAITLDEPIIAGGPDPAYVDVVLSSTNPTRLHISDLSVHYDASEWMQHKTFTVTAVDDGIDNGDVSVTLTAEGHSNSEYYSGFVGSSVVSVTDDDAPTGVTITNPSSGHAIGAGATTVAGTAQANMGVGVYLDDALEVSTFADEDGNWSADITIPPGSHQLVAKSQVNSHYAYLANAYTNAIDVVDIENHYYVQEIPNAQSRGVVFNTHNNTVYSASDNGGNCRIEAYDPLTFERTATIRPAGACLAVSLAISPDGSQALMLYHPDSDYNAYSVLVANLTNNTVAGGETLGSLDGHNASGITYHPDGTHFWVRTQTSVDEFDIAMLNPQQSIDLSPLSQGYEQNIVFSSDGSKGYTTDLEGKVVVFQVVGGTFETIDVGPSVKLAALSPDGSQLYVVASYPTSAIFVIDTTTNQVVASHAVDQDLPPESIAITDDGLWVAGDDHGSGAIFFGSIFGGPTPLYTIYAPNGGSYYTSTGGFASSKLFSLVAASSAYTFNAVGAPNTGLRPTTQ